MSFMYSYIPDIFLYNYNPDEIWVILNWNDILLDRYLISNFGRLYDKRTRRLVGYSTDKDGYYMASITVEGVGYKKIRVHRFELLSFNYNSNYKNLQVNHKDGNKQNLYLPNLEWITPIGNTRHGWDTGLNNNIGVINGNGKYPDEVIHLICKLIDEGNSNADICNEFNITDKNERMKMSALVSSIRYGKSHRYISIQYNFMSGANIANRYSLFMAEVVCQFLSDESRNYTYKEIMDLLDIPNQERLNFKVFIDDIIRGRTAKQISSKYKLKIPSKGQSDIDYLLR